MTAQEREKKRFMTDVGKRIREYRRSLGLSMEDVARAIGVSRQTVHRYENGTINNIPRAKIDRMAALFHITGATLLGYAEPAFPYDNALPVGRRRLPLLGEITCGEPRYADEEQGSVVVSEHSPMADFCLRARGDSMVGARIHDGDLVFVRSCSTVENGEIGVVVIEDEATLKRVYYYPREQKLILVAENPAYAPLVFLGSELEQIRILGKAVAFQSRL